MRRAQPILTALETGRNQRNLHLSARLHLPANSSYFRFVCTFQELYDTCLPRKVLSLDYLAVWSSFHSLLSVLWATLLRVIVLGFEAAQFRPSQSTPTLNQTHAIKWLKVHTQMGERIARRPNSPEKHLTHQERCKLVKNGSSLLEDATETQAAHLSLKKKGFR